MIKIQKQHSRIIKYISHSRTVLRKADLIGLFLIVLIINEGSSVIICLWISVNRGISASAEVCGNVFKKSSHDNNKCLPLHTVPQRWVWPQIIITSLYPFRHCSLPRFTAINWLIFMTCARSVKFDCHNINWNIIGAIDLRSLGFVWGPESYMRHCEHVTE